jgi:hypothetical protein
MITLPTHQEIETAQRALALHEQYQLDIALHTRHCPQLRRAVADMGRVVGRAVIKKYDGPPGDDMYVVINELVNAVFATGLAYGLQIADQRVAATNQRGVTACP